MEFDGHMMAEQLAFDCIATTISQLKRSVAEMNITGSEQLKLALYLMDMLILSISRPTEVDPGRGNSDDDSKE